MPGGQPVVYVQDLAVQCGLGLPGIKTLPSHKSLAWKFSPCSVMRWAAFRRQSSGAGDDKPAVSWSQLDLW